MSLPPIRSISRNVCRSFALTGAPCTPYLEVRTHLPEIKGLYFQRQYKKCTARSIEVLRSSPSSVSPRPPWRYPAPSTPVFPSACCEECDLLTDSNQIDPIHAGYLNFYVALSYDILARCMHQSSTSRLPTLQLAEQHYCTAISLLQAATLASPDPCARISSSEAYDVHPRTPSLYSSLDSGYDTAASHFTLMPATPLYSRSIKAEEADDDPFGACEPSPLRVIKGPPRTTPEALRFNNRLEERDLSAELAVLLSSSPPQTRHPPSDPLSSPVHGDDEDTFAVSTSRHIRRYNTHLADLVSMLQAHLDSVHALIASASTHTQPSNLTTHGSRPASRSSSLNSTAGGSPRKISTHSQQKDRLRQMGDEEKAERIRHGRERGWVRERFCAERYEALCRQALAEL